MTEVLVGALAIVGSGFVLLAAIGVLRMPDVYMRVSTVTKAGTMGIGLLMLAAVLEFGEVSVVLKVGAVLLFGMITSPVAAHAISRAAYLQGVELWEGTVIDEMRGQYSPHTHRLSHPRESELLATQILAESEESQ